MFRISNISVLNYSHRDANPSGTATIVWDGEGLSHNTKIELRLMPEDCAKILDIFADRVQATLAASSTAIIEAQKPPEAIEDNSDSDSTSESAPKPPQKDIGLSI